MYRNAEPLGAATRALLPVIDVIVIKPCFYGFSFFDDYFFANCIANHFPGKGLYKFGGGWALMPDGACRRPQGLEPTEGPP